jgi:cytochrome c553
MTKRRIFPGGCLLAAAVLVSAFAQSEPGNLGPEPAFTADGQLVAPKDYREWMFLSSGLGMTYGPLSGAGATPENPRFENVFVNPPAYQSFLKTGTWPEHTIFVLEIRSSASKLSINKDGRVQTDIAGVEAEVKDSKRFSGKWAFFDLSGNAAAAKQIPATASCYTCHGANGAVDNTFVQFYPTLIKISRENVTFKETSKE